MRFKAWPYQTRAIRFVQDHPACALFMDMGLGKTVSTLTAIDELMFDSLDVAKVLVVAPKSVAFNTWSGECGKWDHLNDLRLSVVMGTTEQRRRALNAEAHIYVTNRDNVVWLISQYLDDSHMRMKSPWPFDCVVLDESSSFKNHQSKRYKAILRVRPFINRLVLLTGTPAPNGLMDLWAQIRLLDGGDRLGRYIGQYRDKYFHAGARNGAVIYEYLPNKGSREEIAEKISDICLSMSASDYLDMPMVIDGGMSLELDSINAYKIFERDCILSLPDGSDIMAVTAVALTNKLLQFSSGALYDDEHVWHEVSKTKMEALRDLVESATEPLLIYYNYIHEIDRIKAAVPDVVPFKGESDLLRRWNDGEIPVMCAHPASVAFGLNMQTGGHIIIWYSPTWNLELYQQANARLIRQGQTKPVILYHLICKGTMDEVVMASLKGKDKTQSTLLNYIKQIRQS